ncbi:RimJ/RimL family protein N-acetyltransferase [Allocatelliglobosispora scoriae]|uniref:RimJ/RimL family protein N-acetyltransferase n=1 Tax=Allocatelliglobosispora scoriae TaxID=643052 RepID=A0A841BWE8_9ACTN|nr:GNAT family protein [Allocatelliglobosispora scoriae]MBB5871092.1 RimJ/RimL family protein N-acetyltransferase [Allocatelliglobosispora scoriae]
MELLPEAIEGRIVELRPLTSDYLAPLATAAEHAEIWTYLDEATPDQNGVAALIDEAVEEQRQGLRLPYVIVERRTSAIIGSISFIDLQPKHRGVEIGWAWVTPSHWRTGAAREAAYLLMRYAFDHGAIRVVFKTDSRNTRSQRAIEGLGATREGVFRNHRILRDGYVRDSIFYSVTGQDWPAVRLRLEEQLGSLPN